MKQKLYVILGDVISSRRIRDREGFQHKLETILENINDTYAEDIFADFKIIKGIDEIGCVLSTMSNGYRIINAISEQLHPNSMRYTMVFDYIDAGIKTRDISKMDGPAFHKASDNMRNLKKSKLMFDMSISNKMIDTAISGQINLILLTKKNWSSNQLQIVKEYKSTNNQDEVAKNLGISQQAVSKTLNRIMWKQIFGIEEKLNNIIEDYAQRLETTEGIA